MWFFERPVVPQCRWFEDSVLRVPGKCVLDAQRSPRHTQAHRMVSLLPRLWVENVIFTAFIQKRAKSLSCTPISPHPVYRPWAICALSDPSAWSPEVTGSRGHTCSHTDPVWTNQNDCNHENKGNVKHSNNYLL